MSAPDNREAEECGFAMSLATPNNPAVLCNLPKHHEGLHCHYFGWQPTSGEIDSQFAEIANDPEYQREAVELAEGVTPISPKERRKQFQIWLLQLSGMTKEQAEAAFEARERQAKIIRSLANDQL